VKCGLCFLPITVDLKVWHTYIGEIKLKVYLPVKLERLIMYEIFLCVLST
jgi:hypothetical protein